MTPALDLDFVRRQFPGLDGEWTLFDNAGGSQILRPVVDRMRDYLLHSNVQVGASYGASQQAGDRVTAATAAMATYVNAADPSEVILGASSTLLTRIMSLCLAETFHVGDEIIVTNCDHEANIGAWVDLSTRGLTIKTWRLNPDSWRLEIEDLRALLTSRTRLVALTHASNILGAIHPIRDIAKLAHEQGALLYVDGVAFAPHRRIDVQALDVDFYVFSFYKVYGPHAAMLYGRHEHLARTPGLNHFFIESGRVPYKFQPGGVNYESCYAMLGLWDYLAAFAVAHGRADLQLDRTAQLEFAFEYIAAHEELLACKLVTFLAANPRVRIIGPADWKRSVRVPTVSFVVNGIPSDAVTRQVDEHKIGIRFGDFYARRLIDDLGLTAQNGVVRVSMVHYNSTAEVEHLIEVLDGIV